MYTVEQEICARFIFHIFCNLTNFVKVYLRIFNIKTQMQNTNTQIVKFSSDNFFCYTV